jgi:hypothetical protein
MAHASSWQRVLPDDSQYSDAASEDNQIRRAMAQSHYNAAGAQQMPHDWREQREDRLRRDPSSWGGGSQRHHQQARNQGHYSPQHQQRQQWNEDGSNADADSEWLPEGRPELRRDNLNRGQQQRPSRWEQDRQWRREYDAERWARNGHDINDDRMIIDDDDNGSGINWRRRRSREQPHGGWSSGSGGDDGWSFSSDDDDDQGNYDDDDGSLRRYVPVTYPRRAARAAGNIRGTVRDAAEHVRHAMGAAGADDDGTRDKLSTRHGAHEALGPDDQQRQPQQQPLRHSVDASADKDDEDVSKTPLRDSLSSGYNRVVSGLHGVIDRVMPSSWTHQAGANPSSVVGTNDDVDNGQSPNPDAQSQPQGVPAAEATPEHHAHTPAAGVADGQAKPVKYRQHHHHHLSTQSAAHGDDGGGASSRRPMNSMRYRQQQAASEHQQQQRQHARPGNGSPQLYPSDRQYSPQQQYRGAQQYRFSQRVGGHPATTPTPHSP